MSGVHSPHLIAPDEIDAWLADSAVRTVTYHATDRASAARILSGGIDIERTRIGSYGQGFYTSTIADAFHGEVQLRLAVRTRRPLVGHADDIGEYIDALTYRFDPRRGLLTPTVAVQIRRFLTSAG